MVKHKMNVIRDAILLVNPGQIPVAVFDQPLFTIAKTVQLKWLDTHGEVKFVVIVEQTWGSSGWNWLENSTC